MKNYIPLHKLEVYSLSRRLSKSAWAIFNKLTWQDKKIMGDQFITSSDSVGANIAEGYKRFHFLEKIKFYYNSRASLAEACSHWAELLFERNRISYDELSDIHSLQLSIDTKLHYLISKTYSAKKEIED